MPHPILPGGGSPKTFDCFNVNFVTDNCVKVYLRINFHFFRDDTGDGPIQPLGPGNATLTTLTAHREAEKLIESANAWLADIEGNSIWHSKDLLGLSADLDTDCIPIRFALSGVYIHDDTDAQSCDCLISQFAQKFDTYLVNPDTELNVFYSEAGGPLRPGGDCNGFANGIPGSKIVIERLSAGLLIHEIGHTLNLRHTVSLGNMCHDVDVWEPPQYSWDADCNGTTDQMDRSCWDNKPRYQGQDACNTANFCTPHPCCDWGRQENILMAYSTWADNPAYAAITPCQTDVMMNNILQQKCDYVADVTATECAPPQSFVTDNYQIFNDKAGCEQCLYLGASVNDHMYRVEIYGKENPEGTSPLLSTAWLNGPAGSFTTIPLPGPTKRFGPRSSFLLITRLRTPCRSVSGPSASNISF